MVSITTYNPLSLSLMLVGAGALIVAAYLIYEFKDFGKKKTRKKSFAWPIGIIGGLTLIFTLQIYLSNWAGFPAHQYKEIFGTTLGIYSLLMIAGAFVLYNDLDLKPISYFSAIGGIWMFRAAQAVMEFDLTRAPLKTGAMYIFAGLSGLSILAFSHTSEGSDKRKWASIIGAIIIVIFALIVLYTGWEAFHGHIAEAVAE